MQLEVDGVLNIHDLNVKFLNSDLAMLISMSYVLSVIIG